MNKHQYKGFTIEVLNEPFYKFDSVDNIYDYSKKYLSENAERYQNSNHGIKIYRDEQIIESCIIVGSGGSTVVHQNSYIIDDDRLLICCCDTIFCVKLPDLELKWKTKTDYSTCFQILKLQEDYIVHGELDITRLDKYGKIKWQFGGNDIFVSIEGKEAFKLEDDHIICLLTLEIQNIK